MNEMRESSAYILYEVTDSCSVLFSRLLVSVLQFPMDPWRILESSIPVVRPYPICIL
jgi:hypothetical protein